MNRDYGAEIDQIQETLNELKALYGPRIPMPAEETKKPKGAIAGYEHEVQGKWNARMDTLMQDIVRITETENRTGSITYLGAFVTEAGASYWASEMVNADALLSLIENKTASQVLNCIGNNDRLNLLLAVLRQPMSVSNMVEACGFNSTGQVYHHLRPLLAADLLHENEKLGKGVYEVQPHRVQGIIMLLAGIADLVDARYTQGDWVAQ